MNQDQIDYLTTPEVVAETKAMTPLNAMRMVHRAMNRRFFAGEESISTTIGYGEQGLKAIKPDHLIVTLPDNSRLIVAGRDYEGTGTLKWYWFKKGDYLDREKTHYSGSLPEAIITAWAYVRLTDE